MTNPEHGTLHRNVVPANFGNTQADADLLGGDLCDFQ
jgi:hypothetical protein